MPRTNGPPHTSLYLGARMTRVAQPALRRDLLPSLLTEIWRETFLELSEVHGLVDLWTSFVNICHRFCHILEEVIFMVDRAGQNRCRIRERKAFWMNVGAKYDLALCSDRGLRLHHDS